MQTKLGIRIGNKAVFVDAKNKTQFQYTVTKTRIRKCGARLATIDLTVLNHRGEVQSSNAIELPQNNTIVMGKLKLAMRQVSETLAVVHFMHPQWCRVKEELCSFTFTDKDMVDAPTRGEPNYVERHKKPAYKNHRSSRSTKMQHAPKQEAVSQTSGDKTRLVGAPSVFTEPYGKGAKTKRNEAQVAGYVAAYGTEGAVAVEQPDFIAPIVEDDNA